MIAKKVKSGEEHWYWESNDWFYINKKGRKVKPPEKNGVK